MLYSTNDQATKLDNTSFKRGASWDTRKSNCYVSKEAASQAANLGIEMEVEVEEDGHSGSGLSSLIFSTRPLPGYH